MNYTQKDYLKMARDLVYDYDIKNVNEAMGYVPDFCEAGDLDENDIIEAIHKVFETK